jgi:hypothetical protein
MSTISQINVSEPLSKEDFLALFIEQLPLTDEEKEKVLNVYFPTYATFYQSGVSLVGSWVAVRNLFISQETQIGERIKNGNSGRLSGGG